MIHETENAELTEIIERYLDVLQLRGQPLRITSDRKTFERWLGRRVSASIGGAYVFLPTLGHHAVFINLRRINRTMPKALELVVAEELIHMRDHLDCDHRRHAKHGYDRIAHRVAMLTGASLTEVRGCLLPPQRRPMRYVYQCPGCGGVVHRRRKGTWSCGRCSPVFDERFVLQIVPDSPTPPETAATLERE